MNVELTEELKQRAAKLGFVRARVAEARALEEDGRRLRRWLKAGFHGEMEYMARSAEVRANPGHEGMLQGARSVLVLATPYGRNDDAEGPVPGKVARYARGRDYHDLLYRRTGKLRRTLQERGFRARCSVDSMPVMERAWARLAGVGFIGKNCCLVVPGLGSFVFLSAVVTDAELRPDRPMRQRCGDCDACLRACPTGALTGERCLDARRCNSYLNGVFDGEFDEGILPRLGKWMYGCDACQEACPFNGGKAVDAALSEPFTAYRRWGNVGAEAFLEMNEEAFANFTRGSAMRRFGRAGVARNAAVVLGNAGGREHLAALERTAKRDPAPAVRGAARWAARRIREGPER